MSEDRIKRFFGHFGNQLSLIENIGGYDYKIHKKILYVSMLDNMARLVCSPKSGNLVRFTWLLTQFASWAESEYVSIPHLKRALELNPDPDFDQLRGYVFGEDAKWQPQTSSISITQDVPANTIASYWPSNKPEILQDVKLDSFKHAYLLYRYRNSLVHEFLALDKIPEAPEDTWAYYFFSTSRMYWSLIYPILFFRKITECALENVEQHILTNKFDLSRILKSGEFWLQNLNP